MQRKRVVVTGLGLVSPYGIELEKAWEQVQNGQSSVTKITRFDVSQYRSQIAAQVVDYHPEAFFKPNEIRRIDQFIAFGVSAARLAHENAGLSSGVIDKDRVGVCIGSGIGGLETIEKTAIKHNHNAGKISPFFIPASITNMISGHVSIEYGFRGPNFSVTTACATGSHSIGLSYRTICYGDADVMLAGGSESPCTPIGLGGFSAMRALSAQNDKPKQASRPFDRDRDGFVIAEGAAVLVLESLDHATKRGANIIAEVTGFGMSGDAFHITQPHANGLGARNAIEHALHDASLQPADVNYINAHGTSTPTGDEIEPQVIKQVFGASPTLAMSSTKSMHGHLLGAAGSLESIWSCLAIRDQVAPPTINLDNPIESCNGINMVPNEAQPMKINYAINNSFGFGGTNTSLVFAKYD